MTNAEYQSTQQQLLLFAAEIDGLNLNGFLRLAISAERAGELLDPVAYKYGHRRLVLMREMAEGARAVQRAHDELRAIIAKERKGE